MHESFRTSLQWHTVKIWATNVDVTAEVLEELTGAGYMPRPGSHIGKTAKKSSYPIFNEGLWNGYLTIFVRAGLPKTNINMVR